MEPGSAWLHHWLEMFGVSVVLTTETPNIYLIPSAGKPLNVAGVGRALPTGLWVPARRRHHGKFCLPGAQPANLHTLLLHISAISTAGVVTRCVKKTPVAYVIEEAGARGEFGARASGKLNEFDNSKKGGCDEATTAWASSRGTTTAGEPALEMRQRPGAGNDPERATRGRRGNARERATPGRRGKTESGQRTAGAARPGAGNARETRQRRGAGHSEPATEGSGQARRVAAGRGCGWWMVCAAGS
jgi:hypothetical protein